jgi:predicted amidohydrolase
MPGGIAMLRIGIAQIHNHFLYERNLECIRRALETHSKNSTELVLFPECATTGYNTGMIKIDEAGVRASVEAIQGFAREYKIAVALPTPWPSDEGKFFNSLLLIDDEGKISHQFNKVGLQRGEEKLFTRGTPHSRSFEFKGHKIGIIICIESMDDAWTYLNQSDEADVVLWPGFYAPTPAITWSDFAGFEGRKLRENVEAWGVPVLQATCASSPEAHHWPDQQFGRSPVLNGQAREVYSAKIAAEDMVQVDLVGREISAVRSIK